MVERQQSLSNDDATRKTDKDSLVHSPSPSTELKPEKRKTAGKTAAHGGTTIPRCKIPTPTEIEESRKVSRLTSSYRNRYTVRQEHSSSSQSKESPAHPADVCSTYMGSGAGVELCMFVKVAGVAGKEIQICNLHRTDRRERRSPTILP